jgi:hypothetical protein
MKTITTRYFLLLLAAATLWSCNQAPKQQAETAASPEADTSVNLSLAQWSLHRAIRSGEMSPYDFAEKAHEMGFQGLEYVNQLYTDVVRAEDKKTAVAVFVEKNNELAAQFGLQNVLIMIDGEGSLSSSDAQMRDEAIENHKLWIDAASDMGCSAVRLNLYGENDPELWKSNSIEKPLCAFSLCCSKGYQRTG